MKTLLYYPIYFHFLLDIPVTSTLICLLYIVEHLTEVNKWHWSKSFSAENSKLGTLTFLVRHYFFLELVTACQYNMPYAAKK